MKVKMIMAFMEKVLLLVIVLQCVGKTSSWNSYSQCSLSLDQKLNCENYLSLSNFKNPEQAEALTLRNSSTLKAGDLFLINLTNLEGLYLNNVAQIELGTFRGLNQLEYLLLESSLEKEMDLDFNVFEDLPHLNRLTIIGDRLPCFSKIAEFPKMNISVLMILGCQIKSIPMNFFKNLQNLTKLHFNNFLKTLDWRLFVNLNNLKEVVLRNPFHCDCRIKFLMDYFDSKNVTWKYPYSSWDWADSPSCISAMDKSYYDQFNVYWHEMDRKLLVCPPELTFLSKSHTQFNHAGRNETILLLECEYTGFPKPDVTLSIDGKAFPVMNNSDAEVVNGVKEFPEFNYKFKKTFLVNLALLSDTGINFTCSVKNAFGSAEKTISDGLRMNSSIPLPKINSDVETSSYISGELVIFAAFVTGFAVGALLFAGYYFRQLRGILAKSSSSREATTVNFHAEQDAITSFTGLIEQ